MSLRFDYQPFPDIDKPLREQLGQYPRVPDITLDVLRTLARWLVIGAIRAQYRIARSGAIPTGERVALLANHRSHLDTLAVLAALPERRRRRIAALAARDYFFERLPRALAASLFGMAVAFDRTRYTELRRWARLLETQREGWLLVYPSGSRKRAEAHDAILFVLAHSGWTLVPVAIEGSAEAWPVGRKLWRPFRTIEVRFGEPLPASSTKHLSAELARFWSSGGVADA
ncbi:MAG TPA: lysophospholipid acyltransferase family protein [Candidatus Limnocylindria bacterium]|jgi:1-acyl-sn-glycerol-3-phosphate acyltransferase|nr:lysophospholipid acyltransferase family protein [Candidatus Limnocylindria bacterium]